MSIKKPSMIKPNIKKPSVAKKPAAPIKPAIAEEAKEVVEEVVVQNVEDIQEDKEIAKIIEERDKEDDGTRYSLEEVKEAIKEVKDVPMESAAPDSEEELQARLEEATQKEAVVEEKPKAKKSSRKSKAKKEEPKVEEQPQEQLPQMSLEDSIEAMADTVNITTEDWEEAKQEIEDKLKALTIDPDMNPATMKHLIGDLDDLMTELRFRLVDIEGQVEFINAQVDYIRSTNSKGSNAEERKANAFLALTNFKKNPDDEEVINLIQYQIFMNNKLNFLNKSIETVRDRRQLLITFNSCMKIESTF